EKPLVDALSVVLGNSGSYISAGLGLISLIGSTIGWIMLSGEVPYQAAKQGLFMPLFLKENKKGVPVVSLTLTNVMSQVFIFSTISSSMSKAFDFVTFIATLSYLVPYIIAAIYQLKLVATGETYLNQGRSRLTDFIIALLGTLYSAWVIKAGTSDMKTFLLGVLMLVAGVVFFPFVYKWRSRMDRMSVHETVKKAV
ncbi:MAG: amino acid permease, partial [Tumebacillaceae bacterium]